MALTIAQAKGILGDDFVGPEELQGVFGTTVASVADIPFTTDEVSAAKSRGELLLLRTGEIAATPLTISALAEKLPQVFNTKLLHASGYALKNDWGILLEPLSEEAVCTAGWALVSAEIVPETRNLSFDEQEEVLRRHITARGPQSSPWRRRSAVEAVYDTAVVFAARGRRLLERSWDWTTSPTEDGGLLQVGGFGKNGLEVLSYSRGNRHGALGACLTQQPGN